MCSKESRKTQLSPHTLKIVAKYLPENNAEKPEGFPVSFSEFCAFTNVREVTINAIKRSQQKSYKIYLENEDCIRAQEYNFYLKFYKSLEARSYSPCCDIIVNGNCSKAQCQLVMSYAKDVQMAKNYPVSFETFCKFTNYDEIVDSAIKILKLKVDKNSPEWQKYARKLYREFYTSKEKRKKFSIRIKPCTKTFKEQLLKFAEECDAVETPPREVENIAIEAPPKRTQCSDVMEEMEPPSPKRARLIPEVGAQTNFEEGNAGRFPVNYDTFLMHTNVKDLAERCLSTKFGPSSFTSFDVVELTRALYVEFYTKPRYENAIFNELFVRQNYADVITAFSDEQLPSAREAAASESNAPSEISGAWCTKIPNTREFGDKYCEVRNENVGNKPKVVIQSIEIIKPAAVATDTMNSSCASGPQSRGSRSNGDGDVGTSSSDHNQSIESDRGENRDEEVTTEATQSNPTEDTTNCGTSQSQSTEQSENVEDRERGSSESQAGTGSQDSSPTYQLVMSDKETPEIIPQPTHELPLQDLRESDEVSQLEPNEEGTPLRGGSESDGACDETVRRLRTPETSITTEDQSRNVFHEESQREQFQVQEYQPERGDIEIPQPEADHNQEQDPDLIETQAAADFTSTAEPQSTPSDCQSSLANQKTTQFSWRYPVSFTNFCKYAKLNDAVESIRKSRESEKSDTTWVNIAREVYENFYTDRERRSEYAISFKPLPEIRRKKFFEFASKVEEKVAGKELDQTSASSAPSSAQSPAKPCEQKIPEKEPENNIKPEDTNQDIQSTVVDSVEIALKAIFDGEFVETSEAEEAQEAPPPQSSTTDREQSVISATPASTESSNQNISACPKQMSQMESESSQQRVDFLRGLSQLRAESLLQPSDLCNSPIPEATLMDNFIDMPNTQQCELLSSNHSNSSVPPLQPDPLNETISKGDTQKMLASDAANSLWEMMELPAGEAPSSTSGEISAHPHPTEEKSKDLIHKKLFPLKNLKFELNESDEDFDVQEIIEEPVLLNDTQENNAFEFHTGGETLRQLVDQLPPSSSPNHSGNEELSFVCPEAQRLPSTMSFENPQAQAQASTHLPAEIITPNEDAQQAAPQPQPQPQQPPKESRNLNPEPKPKRAYYRVVKSKNLAYEVPQILHALRPLPLAGSTARRPATAARRNSAK